MNADTLREQIAYALYVDSRGTTLSPDFVERQWTEGHVVRDEFYRRADAAMTVVRTALANAWDEGAHAQAAAYGMDKDTGPNPYISR